MQIGPFYDVRLSIKIRQILMLFEKKKQTNNPQALICREVCFSKHLWDWGEGLEVKTLIHVKQVS